MTYFFRDEAPFNSLVVNEHREMRTRPATQGTGTFSKGALRTSSWFLSTPANEKVIIPKGRVWKGKPQVSLPVGPPRFELESPALPGLREGRGNPLAVSLPKPEGCQATPRPHKSGNTKKIINF